MHRLGGNVGGVSNRRKGFEDRFRKLGAVGAWLCCVLLIGLGLLPSAIAQTVTYIHTDGLGSVVAESDANGNVIKRYDYEPYGAVVGEQVTDGPGYTGHVRDAATGLSYMQQRYYDPQLGRFLSADPVAAHSSTDARLFGRYQYAFNNPYSFNDPDGRCPVCPVVIFFVMALTHSDPANAPAPGEQVQSGSIGDAVADAVPGGRILSPLKSAVGSAERLSQRAAAREGKRQGNIPTSQQADSQTSGRAPDGTKVGRQQSYKVPKSGGGTETKSVQISRDIRGEHAGMTQVEVGTVKANGQLDSAGRPRIQNEGKIRVDFNSREK